MLKLFNSLTRKIEEFQPLNPSTSTSAVSSVPNGSGQARVGMYTCGPTVYDYQHIGNFRTMIFSDLLARVLHANDFQVKTVRNITDIDDKIINGAKLKGLPIDQFSKDYEQAFFEDLNKLNIEPVDVNPKATDHIGGMIKYIEKLVKNGFAYQEKDGSVYFDISRFADYGKLSGVEKNKLKTGMRILSDEYSKEDVQDFALWKAAGPDEIGYDSPWGRGRPGWHIECSVMSQKYLGESFDIHAGGVDLLFPHHENEIAQSEGVTGKKFANFFVHGEHLLVDSQKMSKSLNNFFKLKDLEERGFEPLAYRYLVLTAHYRDKLNFTWDSLQAAQNALDNLREEIRAWPSYAESSEGKPGQYYQRFLEAANNDLNMPAAVAIMWEMVRSGFSDSQKGRDLLEMDKILGLRLGEFLGKPVKVPEKVQRLVTEREKARQSGNFQKADQLRKEINQLGFMVEDTAEGPRLRQK